MEDALLTIIKDLIKKQPEHESLDCYDDHGQYYMVTIMNKNDFAMLNNIVGGLVKESGKYLDAEVVYIYPDNFGSNIYGECNQIITIKC